jgi:ABC-2 type transport system ATP-binding protein
VILEARALNFAYGGRPVLDGLSFGVARGSLTGVLGPNGCGKSTLFKILATLLRPVSGSALVAGLDTAEAPAAVRRSIGVVFQASSLDPRLTVEENLAAQAALYGLSGGLRRERIGEAVTRFDLGGFLRREASTLSGGERRRVEIAKALLHRPAVLLLDEASAGLDPGARRALLELLGELTGANGVTVLFTTHLMEEAAAAGHLLLLSGGRLVKEGSPAELAASLEGDVVVLRAESSAELGALIGARFGVTPRRFGSAWIVNIAQGHRFLSQVMDAFPGAIAEAAVHKPTLEDVFLHYAGVPLDA